MFILTQIFKAIPGKMDMFCKND